MKHILALAASLFLFVPVVATAQGMNGPNAKPEKSIAHERPVRPPGPVHRSEVVRPGHGPAAAWVRPRASQWNWRGHWVARVRAPAFRYPRGWHYRHWSIGMRLPALFLVTDYFYDDVGPFGLEVPPPGYRWVRYGPDLLLVNLRTGDIEQVAYGVFY